MALAHHRMTIGITSSPIRPSMWNRAPIPTISAYQPRVLNRLLKRLANRGFEVTLKPSSPVLI